MPGAGAFGLTLSVALGSCALANDIDTALEQARAVATPIVMGMVVERQDRRWRLTVLDLKDEVTDADLERIAGAPALRKLKLSIGKATPAGLARLSALADLRELDLAAYECTHESLAALKSVPRLEVLRLSRIDRFPYAALDVLRDLPRLRALHRHGLEEKHLPLILGLKDLEDLGSLECLDDRAILQLAGLPKLRSLAVARVRLRESSSLEALRNLKHLSVLTWEAGANLLDCSFMSGLQSLRLNERCSGKQLRLPENLRSLELYNWEEEAVTSLNLLAPLPQHLERVTVELPYKCGEGLKPVRLAWLARLPALKDLSLRILADAELASLRGMLGLESLSVSYDTSPLPVPFAVVKDQDLELISGLAKLRNLVLQGPRTYTDAGLAHLSKLKHLRRLGDRVWGDGVCAGAAGLATISKLTRLEALGLACPMKEQGDTFSKALSGLGALTHLRELVLWNPPLDGALTFLPKLPKLRTLKILSYDKRFERFGPLVEAVPGLESFEYVYLSEDWGDW
jgi:hypothetical protein